MNINLLYDNMYCTTLLQIFSRIGRHCLPLPAATTSAAAAAITYARFLRKR